MGPVCGYSSTDRSDDGRCRRLEGKSAGVATTAPGTAKSNEKARIVMELDGPAIGDLQLDKPLITIGRLRSNDVQVPNQRVSRLHARIRNENNAWVIEDAESVNGIIYQGERVERLALKNGDKVYIAPTAMLRYQSS